MTRSEKILLVTTELSDIKELGRSRSVRHSGIKFDRRNYSKGRSERKNFSNG